MKKGTDGSISGLMAGSINFTTSSEATIKEIEKEGISAQGRAELIAHLEGKRLYASKAIKAYCYDCMGHYADGKEDCRTPICPLYPFMPYAQRGNRPAGQLAHLPEKNGHVPDRNGRGVSK